MNRLVRILTLLATLALLAACSGSPASSSPSTAPSTAPSTEPSTSAAASVAASGSAAASGDVSLPAPEVTDLKLGVAAFIIGNEPPYIAQDEGIFAKRGLKVELIPFEGDGPAGQALAAGQIDGAFMGGGPVLSANAAGEPLKIVFNMLAVPTDSLVTPVAVQSADDLRGKKIAISTFGGDSHTSVVTALKALGLEQSDVTIVQVGGQSDRYAAVQSGAVQAAPVEGITDDELASLGLHRLIDLRQSGLRLVRAGLAVPAEFIEKNPNTTLNLVAALMEGEHTMLTDHDLAVQTFMKYGSVEKDEAEANVDPVVLDQIDPTGRVTDAMLDLQKEALVVANEAVANVKSSDAYTNQFIDQLDQLGFIKALGITQ